MRDTILIFAYDTPPLNLISAKRIYPFAYALEDFGHKVVIISREWDDEKLKENISRPRRVEISENIQHIYLPYVEPTLRSPSGINKLRTIFDIASGNFHRSQNTLQYLNYIEDVIDFKEVLFMVGCAYPLNLAKLLFTLNRKYKIPYSVDFRDFQNKIFLKKDNNLSMKDKIKKFYFQHYLKKWLSNVSFTTSVSEPICEVLRALTQKNSYSITNGYEKNLFDGIETINNDKFNFSVIGTLYISQDFSILLKGLNLFLNNKSPSEVQLNFIGLKFFPETAKIVEDALPKEFLNITERIPREQALSYMKSSQVLSYIGWKGYAGIYSGKIFEYLGAKRNILVAPSDDDVIEDLLQETKSGLTADTPIRFAEILQDWFEEWKNTGKLSYKGDLEKINFYTRENQSRLFAKKVTETLN